MAWRVAVICTERGIAVELYCVCYVDIGKDISRKLRRVAVNCGAETAVT
jgi:hypothetical protein